jgi:type II secretion system protein N
VSSGLRRVWAHVAFGVLAYVLFLLMLFPYQRVIQELVAEQVPWPVTLEGIRVSPGGVSGALAEIQLPQGYRLVAEHWRLAPDWRSLWRSDIGASVRGELLGGTLRGRVTWLEGGPYPSELSLAGLSAGAVGEFLGSALPAGLSLRGTLRAHWRWNLQRTSPSTYRAAWENAAVEADPGRSFLRLGRWDLQGTLSAGRSTGTLSSTGGAFVVRLQYRIDLARRLPDSRLSGGGTVLMAEDLPASWRKVAPLKRGDELAVRLSGTFGSPALDWMPGQAE